jgi:hypothetical protein
MLSILLEVLGITLTAVGAALLAGWPAALLAVGVWILVSVVNR